MPVKKPGLVELDMPRLLDALESKRRSRHMTQRQVAAVLGVDPATIRQWRRGFGMNGGAALRLSAWLDTDLREFARQDPLPETRGKAA